KSSLTECGQQSGPTQTPAARKAQKTGPFQRYCEPIQARNRPVVNSPALGGESFVLRIARNHEKNRGKQGALTDNSPVVLVKAWKSFKIPGFFPGLCQRTFVCLLTGSSLDKVTS